jgi:hypothetical protein
MDARLSLYKAKEDGQVVLAIHGIRKEPPLNSLVMNLQRKTKIIC